MPQTWITPDGRRIVESGDVVPPQQRWAYSFSYRGSKGPGRFYVGEAGVVRKDLLAERPEAIVRSFSMRGGAVAHIIERQEEDAAQTIVVWEGTYHEIYASSGGAGVAEDVVAKYFEDLNISDSEAGLTIAPRNLRSTATLEMAVTMVRQIGLIELRPHNAVELPRSAGRPVPGGELWTVDLDGSLELLIASDSSVARIIRVDEGRQVERFVEQSSLALVP